MPDFELNVLNEVEKLNSINVEECDCHEPIQNARKRKEEATHVSNFISKYGSFGKYLLILMLFASVLTNIIETNNFINKICQMYSNINKTLSE